MLGCFSVIIPINLMEFKDQMGYRVTLREYPRRIISLEESEGAEVILLLSEPYPFSAGDIIG